jgi:hypothetical protein
MAKHEVYKKQYAKYKVLFKSLGELFELDAKE